MHYSLRCCSLVHLATHGTKRGCLVLCGDTPDCEDCCFHSSDIYELFSTYGSLCPDLVVLNSCVTVTDRFLMDDLDGIVMGLLSCGNNYI